MVSGRVFNSQGDFMVMGDNQIPTAILDEPWQTPASIYPDTWGYRSWEERKDLAGKTREHILQLVEVVSRGGNYLLNIGPCGPETGFGYAVKPGRLPGRSLKARSSGGQCLRGEEHRDAGRAEDSAGDRGGSRVRRVADRGSAVGASGCLRYSHAGGEPGHQLLQLQRPGLLRSAYRLQTALGFRSEARALTGWKSSIERMRPAHRWHYSETAICEGQESRRADR